MTTVGLFASEPQRDNPKAKYQISYKPTREWFYNCPTQRSTVRGDAARRQTCQAIRDAGGVVVKVKQVRGFFA